MTDEVSSLRSVRREGCNCLRLLSEEQGSRQLIGVRKYESNVARQRMWKKKGPVVF